MPTVRAGGFSHHRQAEHNPFSYFYFLMHLREKKESGEELCGVESFVESKVAADSASFFPTYQAMSLKRGSGKQMNHEQQVVSRLDRLETALTALADRMN